MTKQETQQMKGVAILMMLFVHLFGETWKIGSYQSLISFGDTTIEQFLCTAFNPVAFFLLLSGFGLHFVYKKMGGDRHRYSRVAKVYIHYIFISSLFVVIAILLGKSVLPTEGEIVTNILNNLIGLNPTWNPHAWFLLPFSILSLVSPWLFRWIDRIKPWWIFVGALFWGLCTSFVVSRFGSEYLYPNRWLYNIFLPFHLAPSLVLGALIHRCGLIRRTRSSIGKTAIAQLGGYLFIIVLIVAVSFFHPLSILYSFCFTILFVSLHKSAWISKGLALLGEHSMNMWFIHGWLCCTLFMDFFFSFHYSLLIWAATAIVSLLLSYVANWICAPLDRWVGKVLAS